MSKDTRRSSKPRVPSLASWVRGLAVPLSVAVLFGVACGDPVDEASDPPAEDVSGAGIDSGFDLESDTVSLDTAQVDTSGPDVALQTPNLCGGTRDLVYQGLPAEPSAECGLCKDGLLVCDGPNAIRCWGATQPNGCGTCEPLPAEPGEACGICLDGEYACDPDDSLVCSGDSELNLCGGCGVLDGVPGFVCEDEGGDGVTLCRSENEVSCAGAGENACGGPTVLDVLPTQPCGPCSGGVTVCEGVDSTTCSQSDRWVNSCGGCAPLAGPPEETCGLCGGTLVCHPDDPNRVRCDDPGRTICGGCEPLEGELGGACGDDEVWHCDGTEQVVCGDEVLNACGGEEVLDASPGEVCGPCGDGVTICASPEVTVCIDAIQRNVCGGCSQLSGVPGSPCGAAYTWQCAAGDLACLPADDNPVGRIGDACTDLLECDSGLCLVVDSQIQEGFCSLTCADDFDCSDGFECEVLSQETTGTITVCLPRSLCVDPDTDGYGVGAACLGVDCDETSTDINEDAVDVCDGMDNDCDGVIDGNNGECGDPRWIQCVGEGRRASCQEVDGCTPDDDGNNHCGMAVHWTCTEQPDGPPLCDDPNECLDVATWLPDCDLEWFGCEDQVGAPPLCVDLDECEVDNGGCDATFYTCVNVEGAQRLCHDIDECAADLSGNNGCGDADQTLCVNQIGAEPLCEDRDACAADADGYNDCGFASLWECTDQEGAPPLCEDYDECLVDNGECDIQWERCVNRVGLPPVCKDLNECLSNNGGCLSPRVELCVDNVAAPPSCEDYDDCQVDIDGTNACGVAAHWTCTNNDRATATCEDLDECASVLGSNSCGDDASEFLCVDNVGAAPSCTVCGDGAQNLDSINDNGCEYACTPSGPDFCNHRDDDCDGRFDETVAFDTDPENCGDCGVTCALGERVATGGCVHGLCPVRQCEQGYVDADFDPENGCELEHLGSVIWVDEVNGDEDGPGTIDEPFDNIQAGVDAAADGDLVRIAPGSYVGPFTIGTNNLRLEGVARDDVLLSAGNYETVVTVEANGVSLAHFSVQGGDVGVWFRGEDVSRIGDVSAHDLAIRHQGLTSPPQSTARIRGVLAEYATNLTVSQLEIDGLRGGSGGNPGCGGCSSGPAGSAEAVRLVGVTGCVVTGNTIRDLIGGQGAPAATLGGAAIGLNFVDSTDCLIQANAIADLEGGDAGFETSLPAGTAAGIMVTRGQTLTFADNTIVGMVGGHGSDTAFGDRDGGIGGSVRGIAIDSSFDIILRGTTVDRMLSGQGGRWAEEQKAISGSAHAVTIVDSVDVSLTGLAASNLDAAAGLINASSCVFAQGTTGVTIDGMTCSEIGRAWGASGVGISAGVGQISTVWVTNSIISGVSGACVENDPTNALAVLTVADTILWECGNALYTNAVLDDGVRNTDPLLVDPIVGNLNVWPTSPAIDAGAEADDYAAEPSPNGCRRNLGAYGATPGAISAPGADHCP